MRLRFGDFVLDLSARQLERAGNVVPLEPKMYELLELLIRRRPAVVTNIELDELLWPKVCVARTSLTRLVSELRTALGDSSRASLIVRTSYKVGYAFCAEVTELGEVRTAPAPIEVRWMKRVFPLTYGDHVAGRDADCSVAIDGSTVSRQHARITVAHEAVTVEDLGSTNGTYVNGTRINAATRLAVGDELSLGSEVLAVTRRRASALTVRMEDDQAGSKLRTK
jgi:DNA-binding winged helix-turn-helix (wHTH) protein